MLTQHPTLFASILAALGLMLVGGAAIAIIRHPEWRQGE